MGKEKTETENDWVTCR